MNAPDRARASRHQRYDQNYIPPVISFREAPGESSGLPVGRLTLRLEPFALTHQLLARDRLNAPGKGAGRRASCGNCGDSCAGALSLPAQQEDGIDGQSGPA